MVGALLTIVGAILSLLVFQDLTSPWLVATLAWNMGIVLLLLGLPGVIARQVSRAGWLGFVGALMLILGLLLDAGYIAIGILAISTWLVAHAPQVADQLSAGDTALFVYTYLELGLLTLGGLLLGIATMRARLLPRAGGVLLIVGAILSLVGSISPLFITVSGALLALGGGWLGYGLWKMKSGVLPEPVATAQGMVAQNP
jgi:hypothetical protein